MADNKNIVTANIINDVSLKNAYNFLLDTLSKNNLKATAAFVTCFAAEPDVVCDNIALFEEMAVINPAWFTHVLPVLRSSTFDGWNGSNFYRAMSIAGHEMAWHGTTHLPMSEQTSAEVMNLEMELAVRLFTALGHTPRTIIFPRNHGGPLNLLRSWGFETYRAELPFGFTNRMSRLLNEWNIFDEDVMDKPGIEGDWNVSPAGHFLNWPSGIRAVIPIFVTIRRWKSLLRYAVERGGYVHMWFHPHNLITAPAMKIAFDEIMSFVGELVKSGDLVNLTMAEANDYYKKG